MVTNSAALAQRVEAVRRREGVPTLRLAIATGIKRSTLTRRLAGEGDFKVWQLIRISQHFTDCNVDAEALTTEWMSNLPVATVAVSARPSSPVACNGCDRVSSEATLSDGAALCDTCALVLNFEDIKTQAAA
jgi:hypothetical protein